MNAQEILNQSNPEVIITVKDLGDIRIQLFPEVAKNTVDNFIKYVQNNYYDNLIFHRVIKGFMIQGGWGKDMFPPIKGEFLSNGFKNPLKHTKGVLSMARTMNPNSQTAQFFIMHENSPHLDNEYAAFGVVTSGIEVVNQIAEMPVDRSDRPRVDVMIESVKLVLNDYKASEPVYFI